MDGYSSCSILLGLFSVALYANESRLWLFNNPKDESKRVFVFICLCGQLPVIAYIVMMIFTPLHFNNRRVFHNYVLLPPHGIFSYADLSMEHQIKTIQPTHLKNTNSYIHCISLLQKVNWF
jgi:hypothetical protein